MDSMEEMDETKPFHALAKKTGGSILLKEKMQEMEIPMLILDGDGIDRRNSHDGQIKTRLEAFLEMLDTGETQETSEKEEKKIC